MIVITSFTICVTPKASQSACTFLTYLYNTATVNERVFVNLGACTRSHDRVSETERFSLLFWRGIVTEGKFLNFKRD